MVEIPLERMDKIAVGARMIFTGYDVERRMKMNFAIARYSNVFSAKDIAVNPIKIGSSVVVLQEDTSNPGTYICLVTSGTIATVDIATDHESLGRSVAVGANYYKYIILRSELEYIEPQTVKKESEKMANTEKKSSQKKTASRAITNLGRVIFMCRSILGLSVREMAEEIGLSHATVSRIENGHQVDAETLMKIMNWFVSKSEDSGTPFQSAVQSISFSLIRRDKRVVIKKS